MLRDHAVIPFYDLITDFPHDIDRDIFKTIVQAFERRGHIITDQPPADWWLKTANKRQRRR